MGRYHYQDNPNARQTRKATNKILEMVEAGALDRDNVILACLKYMSEDDVADMAHTNEFFPRCTDCGDSADLDNNDRCADCAKTGDDSEEG